MSPPTTPFKTPPQPPPTFTTSPSSLLTDTEFMITTTRALQDKFTSSITLENATFANVILPLALNENKLLRKRKIIKFYSSTSPFPELREASNVAEALFVDFDAETLMREDLFMLFDAVLKRNEEDLDEESRFYLETKRREFWRNGLGIKDVEKRERFLEVKKTLHEKIVESRKCLNASAGIWFTRGELDGLPENILNGLTIGVGENEGKLWLPLKKPHLETALKYARNPETRRTVYVGNDNRCMDNVPRFRDIILLRDEAARLLGYQNHAEFQLEVKTAGSVGFVNNFFDDLRERLTPLAKLELQALKELKSNDSAEIGKEKDDKFYIWDYDYYANLIKVRTNSFDEKKFSEYFTLEKTLSGMLDVFSRLFGLQFRRIHPEQYSSFGADHIMTWHELVSVYSVCSSEKVNDGDKFVGYLYLDLFPRKNKYNHAGHYLLQPGHVRQDGTYYFPSSALVMNIPAPQAHKPTLLSHDSIRSLFHELGHAMHNLLSRTKFAFFHGTATVKDFVEIPSIMLENWWWTPSVIREIGCHYSYVSDEMFDAWQMNTVKIEERPTEKLEDGMIHNLISSRRTNEALATLKQCHFTMFDMVVHSPSSRAEAESMNFAQIWNQMINKITMMSGLEHGEGWEWGHGYSRFGHLVRGHDAGYYAYPLGKAYAQDLFVSMFQENPMSRETGLKYHKTVLEKGASRNGMKLLEQFLGRRPNAAARYKELGLC